MKSHRKANVFECIDCEIEFETEVEFLSHVVNVISNLPLKKKLMNICQATLPLRSIFQLQNKAFRAVSVNISVHLTLTLKTTHS